MIIWRDDDILMPGHRLEDLVEVDALLQAHGRTHTIAVLAATLTPELATVLRARGMSVQVHAWQHDDLSVDEAAIAQLPAAVDRITDLIGVRPTALYPPWNRTSRRLERAAAALGLIVSAQKISLDQFIRVRGNVGPSDVINFHYWHEPDRQALRQALDYVPRRAA